MSARGILRLYIVNSTCKLLYIEREIERIDRQIDRLIDRLIDPSID